MPYENPRAALGIVLCSSLIVYVVVAAILFPFLIHGGSIDTILGQTILANVLLLLLFLLPASYIYWHHRIQVKLLIPTPAAVEPGEIVTVKVVTGFPGEEPIKGATLEAFFGSYVIATDKLEGSPFDLEITVPPLRPGYHKISVKVSKAGLFAGTSYEEILVTPRDFNSAI
jgi:hypothetical protein